MKAQFKLVLLAVIIAAFVSLCGCGGGSSASSASSSSTSGINPPKSSDALLGQPYEDVVTQFKDAGFTNVSSELAGYMAESNVMEPGKVETVKIGGDQIFSGTDSFDPSSQVVVYYSAQKYKVALEIACQENLMLSRYDLKAYVDGVSLGEVDHGATRSFEVAIPERSHELKLAKSDEEDVDGAVDFEVTKDGSIKFEASCHSDNVDVTNKASESTSTEPQSSKSESSSSFSEAAESEPEEEVLTVSNCKLLKKALKSDDESDWDKFATKYQGRKFVFKGNVAALSHRNNYKTRWDVLFNSGNYSTTSANGAIFHVTDTNASEMGLAYDAMRTGDNVTVSAEVVNYNGVSGYIEIEPYLITKRK